ncbi:glycerol-3-phosphate acyltransferase [Niallia taxi]|uniref:glycerol-3-phosphate acyltransferase n=1 Tax=Niallia taxi TaxID=2499688 RepID=UPI00300B98D2
MDGGMLLVLYLICAYFVGNLLFGFIVGKMQSGGDIRAEGSKNPGARNAGRLYGKKALILTFLGDAMKGAAVIIIGRLLGFSTAVQLFGLLFVCIGHIKPVLFQMKGGKGISTLIGGLLAVNFWFVPIIIISFFLFYLLYKGFTVPGLLSLLVCAVALFFIEKEVLPGIIALLVVTIVICAHKLNWRQFLLIRN